MSSFKILNKTGSKITVCYFTDDGMELIPIANDERKKILLPEISDKIIYIKRYDKNSSSLCMGNSPWGLEGNSTLRSLSPIYYNSFDCTIDISNFYHTLVIYECSYSFGYKLFSLYVTDPDRIIEYNYQSDKDRKKLKVISTIFLIFLRSFFALLIITGVYGFIFFEDYWVSIFALVVGLGFTIFHFKWARTEKAFEKAELKEILDKASFVRVKEKKKHYIVYDYLD